MYRSSALLVAALAAATNAVQFDIPASGIQPVEGETIVISYSDAEGPVTVTLKNGASSDLDEVEVIGTGSAGSGTISWTPEGLPSDTYALEIDDGTESNYSPQFSYQGTGAAVTTTETSTTEVATVTESTSITTTTATPLTTTGTGFNSTMTTMTTSSFSSSSSSNISFTSTTTSEDAATTTEPVNQNDEGSGSARIGSSMALVLGAAALFIFN